MGFNKKVLSKAVSELGKAKAPAKPRDITVDPKGYWNPANQGQPVRVPGQGNPKGVDITMHNVNQPIWAQPNVGPGAIMYPEDNRHFSGASYVDETQIGRKGGTLKSKKYSKSMSATNKLFAKNNLFKSKKSKIFDPNAEFKSGGSKLGPINLNPNPLSHYELNYGFNLPTKQDGGVQGNPWLYTSMQENEGKEPGQIIGLGADFQHKSGLHGEANVELPFFNRNAEGMSTQSLGLKKSYKGFTGDATLNNESYPGSKLNPSLKTSVGYNKNLGDHVGFGIEATNNSVPGKLINPSIQAGLTYNFQDGGENEDEYMDLTDEEIQAYRDGGYVVDEEPEYEIGGYVQHELVKAQKGGTRKPLEIADPKEYAYRNKMYADSLSAYNQSLNNNKSVSQEYSSWKDGASNQTRLKKGDSYGGVKVVYNKSISEPSNFKNPHPGNEPIDYRKYELHLPRTYSDGPHKGEYTGSRIVLNKTTLPIYKKPVQPVTLKNGITNINYTKSKITPYKKAVQPVKFKKANEPINTTSNNTTEPISTLPLKPIERFVSPEQTIIPGKPYIKPKPNVGPRYGTLAGDENLDLPSNYTQAEREAARRQRDAQEYQRKNLEYQQQQRGNEPVAQVRKQGGILDTYQKKGEVKTFKRDIKDQDAQSNTGWSSAPVQKKKVVTTKKTPTTLKEKLNQTPQQAFDTDFKVVTAKENAELKEKTREQNNAFKNQQMPGYKDYGPQSAGSADWFWTLPIAGPAALEAAGSLGAMSLPGMASVPGATLGNAANAGFIAHGITQTPETIKAWDDVSKGKKSWSDAALETGINLGEFIGAGSGIKSLAQDINQGSKYLGKTLGTETGLLSNTYKHNPWASKLAKYNRVAGEDAIIDLQNNGIVRAGDAGGVRTSMGIRTTPYPSFGKGVPRKTYIDQTIQQGKVPYILSTNRSMGVSTLGRHGKGSTMFPIDESGKYMESFPASEVQIFEGKPHWLKGYPEVPKKLPGSSNVPIRSGLGSMDMSKYEIKNPDYYTQLLGTYDSKALSPTNKKFYKDLIGSIKNQNGLVTERQFNELQRLKSGNFNFGKKGYQEGGITEAWEDELDEHTIKLLRKAGYTVEELD